MAINQSIMQPDKCSPTLSFLCEPMAPSKTLKTRAVRKDTKKSTVFKPHKPHKKTNDNPWTTAKPLKEIKEDLTLSDWLEVIEYVEHHPGQKQADVVKFFASRKSGVLSFTQSALSKKLKVQQELRERAASNPSALSGKRARVVTCPDVEEALFLWQQDMQRKNESVNGLMLVAKQRRFEELFQVPEDERLTGTGWLTSFKTA